jgi:NADPH:quinone reductase-like Zn-dependent oxidoreductase
LFAFLTTCYITGTWRQHGKAEESALVKVPNDIPAAYAATLTINPTTAYCLLREFEKLQPGDVIIQVSNGITAHRLSRSLFERCCIALKVAFTNATFNFLCFMLTEWGRTVLCLHLCSGFKNALCERDADLVCLWWMLQNGANSFVGQMVVQMAREMGIKTVNVVRANR